MQKAFFVSFEKEALTLLDNYLDNVEAYLHKNTLVDAITGEEVSPNEILMRSIEEKIQVPDHGKESFRNEIFRKVAMANRRGERFDYTTHEKLKEAIEKQLFEEHAPRLLTIVSQKTWSNPLAQPWGRYTEDRDDTVGVPTNSSNTPAASRGRMVWYRAANKSSYGDCRGNCVVELKDSHGMTCG